MIKIELSQQELELLAIKAEIYLASNSFWDYCCSIDGEFYDDSKPHLRYLCDTLENFYHKKLIQPTGKPFTKLAISMPPQHGKTRTMVHFCEWTLGNNNWERIITASYNDSTSSDFSRYVRDGIQREKFDLDDIVFSDIFPKTKIKQGHSGHEKWALSGQHFNYMGVGIGGSITSKGATILIIDDPIKGAVEAYNINHLNKVWTWYTGTFLSRVAAAGGKPLEIIVMTRWSNEDILGRNFADKIEGPQWFRLEMEAYDEKRDEMLCPQLLDKEAYEDRKRRMDRSIFLANYHQKPVQLEGTLYSPFKTYDHLPKDEKGNSLLEGRFNYTDTADEGKDYLCSINYGVYEGMIYVLDVLYTKKKMEFTEPATAKMLYKDDIGQAVIESNNGGRGFARNVARIYKENYGRIIPIKWFHQSKNKRARIFSNSARVNEIVMMPRDWHNRWSDFFNAIMTYIKEGTNDHDDGPDALTGCVEKVDRKLKPMAFNR